MDHPYSPPAWINLPLNELSPEQWEALCDGCAKCCLYKFEDEDTGRILYTNVACPLLNLRTCRCPDYEHRSTLEPNCIHITLDDPVVFTWLPSTCAYRLRYEGKPLPGWHPLVSGNPASVHAARISIVGKAIAGEGIPDDKLEQYIVESWD